MSLPAMPSGLSLHRHHTCRVCRSYPPSTLISRLFTTKNTKSVKCMLAILIQNLLKPTSRQEGSDQSQARMVQQARVGEEMSYQSATTCLTFIAAAFFVAPAVARFILSAIFSRARQELPSSRLRASASGGGAALRVF